MGKTKKTPIAEKMQKSAEKLRGKAKLLRQAKGSIAEHFVRKVSSKGAETTSDTLVSLKLVQKGLGIYIHGAKAANLIFKEIGENPKLRAQAETLVANIAEDVSARLNEFANIVDSVSKSPDIQEAFENLREALDGLKEYAGKASALKRKFRKEKFHVVEEDEETFQENH